MIKKGIVSSINSQNRTARVTFPDMDNIVSPDIPYAAHVSLLIGSSVAVVFFSENMKDGLIFSTF